MTELNLARNATRWLRTLGLAVLGFLISVAVAVGVFSPAQSSNLGADSEIDNYGVFDGISSRATFATRVIPATNTVTLEAWVKPELVGAVMNRTIVAQAQDGGGADAGRLVLAVTERSDGKYYIHLAQSTVQGSTSPIDAYVGLDLVQPGVWSHVAAAINSTSYSIYLNGQLVASASGLAIGNIGDGGTPTFQLGQPVE
jgi:hypothetical protein